MPDEVLRVDIRTKPENRKKCSVTPKFRAKQGSTIVFHFDEFKKTAEIIFLGPSPLETPAPIRPGPHKVRKDAPSGQVEYTVIWPDAGGGDGNGSGEVIPG